MNLFKNDINVNKCYKRNNFFVLSQPDGCFSIPLLPSATVFHKGSSDCWGLCSVIIYIYYCRVLQTLTTIFRGSKVIQNWLINSFMVKLYCLIIPGKVKQELNFWYLGSCSLEFLIWNPKRCQCMKTSSSLGWKNKPVRVNKGNLKSSSLWKRKEYTTWQCTWALNVISRRKWMDGRT